MNTINTTLLTRIIALVLLAASLWILVGAVRDYLRPQVVINWSTATELDTAGFNLYRAAQAAGPYSQANDLLIPSSPDPLTGGEYEFVDVQVRPGVTYFYQLEEVEYGGAIQRFDPIQVTAGGGPLSLFLAGVTVAGALLFLLLGWRPRRQVTP